MEHVSDEEVRAYGDARARELLAAGFEPCDAECDVSECAIVNDYLRRNPSA